MMLGVLRQSLRCGTVVFPVKKVVLVGKNYSTAMKELTVHDALNSALDEEMAIDPKVYIMGEKVGEHQGAYKISRGLLEKHGLIRVLHIPITEAEFSRIEIGMTGYGLRPVVEFMTYDFSWQAIGHFINSPEKSNYMSDGELSFPIVFRGPNKVVPRVGDKYSKCTKSCYAAQYASYPFVKVLAPYSSEDARGLLKAAIRDPTPVIFLENELLYGESFPVSEATLDSNFCIPIGKAKTEREGKNVTITSFSKMVGYALQAAEILSRDGISAEVINLRSICPLDRDAIIASVKKTNRLVTVEEGFAHFGIGAQTCEVVYEECYQSLNAPVEQITGAKHVPRELARVGLKVPTK